MGTPHQWNSYYETLVGPRWIELHFSGCRQLIASIVASMQVTPKKPIATRP